jgi:hypothetical protein
MVNFRPHDICISDETDKLDTAMAAVRHSAINVIKDTDGYGYKYPQLNDILEQLNPLLEKYDLADYIMPCSVGGKPALAYRVVHTLSSQFIMSAFVIEEAGMSGANSMQQLGATMTYCSRYFRVNFWGIGVWDGDGANFQVSQAEKDDIKALIEMIPKEEARVQQMKHFESVGWNYKETMDRKKKIEALLSKQKEKSE